MPYDDDRFHWPHPCHCDHLADRLDAIDEYLRRIMSSLTDLQAADASLKNEVATFLADVANALQADNPDINAVVADINSQVDALRTADPANAQPTTPTDQPPADQPPADQPPATA